jgi:hypothetical protein
MPSLGQGLTWLFPDARVPGPSIVSATRRDGVSLLTDAEQTYKEQAAELQHVSARGLRRRYPTVSRQAGIGDDLAKVRLKALVDEFRRRRLVVPGG